MAKFNYMKEGRKKKTEQAESIVRLSTKKTTFQAYHEFIAKAKVIAKKERVLLKDIINKSVETLLLIYDEHREGSRLKGGEILLIKFARVRGGKSPGSL